MVSYMIIALSQVHRKSNWNVFNTKTEIHDIYRKI